MSVGLGVVALVAASCVLAVKVYDFLSGRSFVRDNLWRWQLGRRSLAEWDALAHAAAISGKASELVVCLTTTPSRAHALAPTLASLCAQQPPPKRIRLHLPLRSVREGCSYELPAWLTQLRMLELVRCEDLGPASKLLPALDSLDADQGVLVVDDDKLYPPGLVASFERAARERPNVAWGASGWCAPSDLVDRPTTLLSNLRMLAPAPIKGTRLRSAREVDVLQGYSGYLVRPRFFDPVRVRDYSGAPEAAFFADDVWISAHCRVPKRVLPAERYCIPVLRHAALHARTAISRLNRGGGVPEQRANSVLLRHFAEVWRARSRTPSLRAVVVNHARNREAHELVQALRAHVPALAIDSGSTFAAGEEAWFDLRLPNVFYSGLFNAAVAACADLADDDVLYFVCSDVSVPDAGRALERTRIAFADPRIGVYGASAQGTSFSTMRNRGSGGLRELPFVEGFCFAARMSVLRAVAPVDTALNTLGWGIDIHLAFAARVAGLRCVVDDAVQVTHDMGSGYSQEEALAQMKAWFAAQPAAVQLGQRLIFRSWAQTRLGTLYLQVFPWARWYARQMQQVAP